MYLFNVFGEFSVIFRSVISQKASVTQINLKLWTVCSHVWNLSKRIHVLCQAAGFCLSRLFLLPSPLITTLPLWLEINSEILLLGGLVLISVPTVWHCTTREWQLHSKLVHTHERSAPIKVENIQTAIHTGALTINADPLPEERCDHPANELQEAKYTFSLEKKALLIKHWKYLTSLNLKPKPNRKQKLYVNPTKHSWLFL